MSKKHKTVVSVPSSWTTYLVDDDSWENHKYMIDGSPSIVILDGLVKAGKAERLSQLQMIAIDDVEMMDGDDGSSGFTDFTVNDEGGE